MTIPTRKADSRRSGYKSQSRQLPDDVPRHRFPLCAAVPKRYAYTIGHGNAVVSRACAEAWLQSKNADKDTDCILISVLIWWR